MSRLYAHYRNGIEVEKILVYLICDKCSTRIKPDRLIAEKGWTKVGWDSGLGTEKFEQYYCPDCSK